MFQFAYIHVCALINIPTLLCVYMYICGLWSVLQLCYNNHVYMCALINVLALLYTHIYVYMCSDQCSGFIIYTLV